MPLYHGNYGPVREMQNGVMLRGWTEQEYSGKEISVDGTYRDNLSVVLKGEHSQKTNSGSNLLPFPYTEMYKEYNGVTYEVQDDGGIAVSGTPTDYSYMRLYRGWVPDSDKITISISGTFTNIMLNYTLRDATDATLVNASVDSVTGGPYTTIDIANEYPTAISLEIIIKQRGNAVCSGVIYVMINAGDTPLSYEQYNPSKNLVNPYEAESGVSVDNGVTGISAWGSIVFSNTWVLENLKPSTTYYAKARVRLTHRPDETHPVAGSPLKSLTLFSAGDKTLYPTIAMFPTYDKIDVGSDIAVSKTFTTPPTLHDPAAGYKVIGYSERWLSAEDSSNAALGTVDFLDIIVSEVDVPYSQYGSVVVSPSTDCPSDILPIEEPVVKIGDVGEALGVVLYGNGTVNDTFENDITATRPSENLLPYPYTNSGGGSQNGVTYSVLDDGGVEVSGIATGYMAATLYSGSLLTTDVVTFSIQGDFTGMIASVLIYADDDLLASLTINDTRNYTYTVNFADYPTANKFTFLLKRLNNGIEVNGVIYPMVNLGETALPYEKYGKTIAERKSRLTKHWAEVTFDGTEKWLNNSSDEVNRYCPSLTNYDRSAAGLCTHLPVSTNTAKQGVYFGASANFIVEGSWTLDSWKEYLAAQYAAGTPVKLLYKLLEPEVALFDPVLLYTVPKHTDISCEAEMVAKIKTVSE